MWISSARSHPREEVGRGCVTGTLGWLARVWPGKNGRIRRSTWARLQAYRWPAQTNPQTPYRQPNRPKLALPLYLGGPCTRLQGSVTGGIEESILGQARVYRLRHSTSKVAQRSLRFQISENRAKTAKEAHHETIRLHLCFPSTSTVLSAFVSLHDCIFMVHQFTTCGVHPAIAFCLLSLLAGRGRLLVVVQNL